MRVVRNRVFVAGDADVAQHSLGILASDALRSQVDQHHVGLGASGDQAQPSLLQCLAHCRGIGQHLLLVDLELGFERFLERHRLAGDRVHQRAALRTGEDGRVDRLLVLLFHQDHAAARAPQAFVRGGGHEVGVRHGVRVNAARDEAGVVGHVDHEVGAHLFRDLGKALEVDAKRIGRRAGDDQLRPLCMGQARHLVVVDFLMFIQAVAADLEPLAADVQRHAVRQMAPFGQAHAEDAIARLERREEHGLIGLRAGMRLHIGRLGAEQLLEAADGQALCLVHDLAAAVIALARIAFGVLVGQLRADGGHHCRGGVVF
ncbi:hypothetical protein D3C71_1092400 [compost metagenome]